MAETIKIQRIYPKSFRANAYSKKPFRMIGLINADIEYYYGQEVVTLGFYRSSGTYSGKTYGLWYPILGIKMRDGEFTEFTDYINLVLTNSTRDGQANEGWLAKSLFFADRAPDDQRLRGFSNGRHHEDLLGIGKTLRGLYESRRYRQTDVLDPEILNRALMAERTYPPNSHTQRENFERLIEDIFTQDVLKREAPTEEE